MQEDAATGAAGHAEGSGSKAPPQPQLLAPQPLISTETRVAAIVIAACLGAGVLFMLSGGHLPATAPEGGRTATHGSGDGPGNTILVGADQVPGTFRILAASFHNNPASVLAQLNMPEAEKQRLAHELADGSVRLAAVTLWDTMDEDGDIVDVAAAGFSQRLTIMHKPTTFFLPVQFGRSVSIKGVRDGGGGGITLGVRTILGPLPLPRLAVGQIVELPIL